MIKNMKYSAVLNLEHEVEYAEGQVISKTIAQNKDISMTLFSFDQHEGLSTHTATGDALVQILDGTALIVIDGDAYTVHKGEAICMPANVPHSLSAITPFKMFLTVVFPQ